MSRNGSDVFKLSSPAPIFMADGKPIYKDAPFWIYYFLITKSAFGTLNNRVCFQTRNFSKIGGNIFIPFNNYFSGNSLVSLLFFLRCPPAILRGIANGIIYPIKRITMRSLAHILDKIMKTETINFPSFTYGQTTPSVIGPLSKVRICAAINHLSPNTIKRMRVFEWHKASFINPSYYLTVTE